MHSLLSTFLRRNFWRKKKGDHKSTINPQSRHLARFNWNSIVLKCRHFMSLRRYEVSHIHNHADWKVFFIITFAARMRFASSNAIQFDLYHMHCIRNSDANSTNHSNFHWVFQFKPVHLYIWNKPTGCLSPINGNNLLHNGDIKHYKFHHSRSVYSLL